MPTLAAVLLTLAPLATTPPATLVVFRREAEPLLFSPTLLIDGVEIGRIGTNRYVAVELTAGVHRIDARWPPLAGHRPASLTLRVGPDNLRYVELTGTAAFWRTAAVTTLVERPADQAEPQLKACCRPLR